MDCFRPRFRLLGLMLFVAILFPSSLASSAQSQRDADTAISDAIAISALESDKNADALYQWMHPDAQEIVPESAVVGWYTNDFFPLDPHPISEILDIQFISWAWPVTGKVYPGTAEIRFIQPFGPPGNVKYQEETVRLVEVDGQWRWFFGRSRAFVDEQIAIYAAAGQPTSNQDTDDDRHRSNSRLSRDSSSDSNRNTRNDSSRESRKLPPKGRSIRDVGQVADNEPSRSSREIGERRTESSSRGTSCTVVELYPGYPGYRGNITGVMPLWNGQGDYECLETLEQREPGFNQSREDRANQQAADNLGIEGPMEVWTWENWMYIEEQRGMDPSCYSCLMLDTSTTPIRTDLAPPTDDVRIATGMLGSAGTLSWIASYLQLNPTALSLLSTLYDDDYQVRAIAYFGDPTMNAAQLLQAMVDNMERLFGPQGYGMVDGDQILHRAIWQVGGYIPVPASASPDDQIFFMSVSIDLATTHYGHDEQGKQWFWGLFQNSLYTWYETGMRDPLSMSMQSDGNWLEYENVGN